MDPFAGATTGSLFAPHPKAYPSLSPSLHRQGSNSPMPTRPDTLDDPFFSPQMSHLPQSAPIPHTSVPFAPTELAVLQRWSQVYHSHRARCPVGPPPGMPAAVYDIFERLGGAAPFAGQAQPVVTADFTQDVSAPSSQNTATTVDETEPFRPEAWSSGTATDSQPTPGLYRSPEGDATSVPSSSSPTNTIRSTSSARHAHVFGAGAGVRSSPSYGALDQHMRALELKRGMKKSAAGHGRNKMSRTVSAPIKTASGSKPSGSSVRSSPLVGMTSSTPSRQSSPLVGLGSGPDGQSTYEPMGFQTYGNQPQAQQATVFGSTEAQQQSFSFSAGYDADQSTYTEAPSAILDAQGLAAEEEGDKSLTAAPLLAAAQSAGPAADTSAATANGAAPPKEKAKVRATASASDRTDPNTMPDRNDPNVVIIDDPDSLRGMRYEDFEAHMFIGREALGTEYPRNLEPGAGHERIRCLLCKCGYAGPNGRSMWRRHVSQKHVILLAGKRGTVTKKKEGIPDEAAVITTYMEKRERTLASKKRYASKKRMDQRNDRLAAQGFDASKVAADESMPASQETELDEDGDGDDEIDEIEEEPQVEAMPLQDVPPNSSEGNKPKLRLKPLAKPTEAPSGPENALPPSSPLSPVPTTSVSVSPSEPVHSGPTFSFNTPGPMNSTYLFSPFDDDHRRGGFGVLGKAFGDDMDTGLGKAFGDEIKLGGVKRVRPFKSTARLDDDSFPLLAVGLSSPLRIGRAHSVGAVEQSPTRGSRVMDVEETGSEPETPRTNAAKVAARRLQLFALESPVANVTPMRRVPPRGTLTRSLTTPVMSTKLGSQASWVLAQTPFADGEEELARALGLAPDMMRHEHSEYSPVRKRKRGPNTPFPIYPSSRLRESLDDPWPPSPFVINTPAPAPKRARKDKNKEEGLDSYANDIIAGDLLVES